MDVTCWFWFSLWAFPSSLSLLPPSSFLGFPPPYPGHSFRLASGHPEGFGTAGFTRKLEGGRKAPGTRLQDLVHEKAACTPIRGLPSLLPAPGDEWRLGQKFRAETKVTSFRCANPIPRHRQFTDDPAIRRADGRKGQRDPKHGSPLSQPLRGERHECARASRPTPPPSSRLRGQRPDSC